MPHPSVDPPVPATAVLVDLRNFTPNLNAAPWDEDGTNEFCFFLADFYDATLEAALLALPPRLRREPPISVNGTGDGLLVVFLDGRHYAHGLLAAFLLDAALDRACRGRGVAASPTPDVGFGAGVESGEVSVIRAGGGRLSTVIGHCVNIAARIEGVTKVVASARVAVGNACVELCAKALRGVTFTELRERERQAKDDAERVSIQKQMDEMNRALCLTFLDHYVLKGVDEPLPLYRIDGKATRSGVERFDRLLSALVEGDEAHLTEVRAHLGR